MIEAATEWAAASGPPNGVFLFAVLTSPAVWSRRAVQLLRERLGRRGEGDS